MSAEFNDASRIAQILSRMGELEIAEIQMDNRGFGEIWHQNFERTSMVERATVLREPTHARAPLLDTGRPPLLDNMPFFNDYDPTFLTNLGHNFAQNFATHYHNNGQFPQNTFLPSDACTTLPSPAFSSLSTSATSRKTSGGQPCQVCMTAVSNGLHFGAKTCAACAAFFRRTISDQKRYVCKRSQRCGMKVNDVTGYRKICRSCRMKRCLDVGMLPENVQHKRQKRDPSHDNYRQFFSNPLQNAVVDMSHIRHGSQIF